MSDFRQVDRRTGFLPPPSVDEWLPERHLARFVVELERASYDPAAFRFIAANDLGPIGC